MTHVVITGGTGLIGRALLSAMDDGIEVSCVGRNPAKIARLLPSVTAVAWSDVEGLKRAIARADVVINLAGENIGGKRWSTAQKQRIIDSRVDTTRQIVDLIHQCDCRARLINASAIGVYGLQQGTVKQQQTVYVESSPLPAPPKDFLAEVGAAWEAPLHDHKAEAITTTICRFAVVLSPRGGVLQQLLLPYRFGLGGVIGSGEQPLSWVAIDDVVRVIVYFIANACPGVFNLVNGWVKQRDFAKCLAKALRRPALLPMPAVMVKLLFGEMGDILLLQGQAVASEQLALLQPLMRHHSLATALESILHEHKS